MPRPPNSQVSKITSNIWIGNSTSAKNKDFFRDNQIRAVLNCTTDIENYFRSSKSIEYLRIPVEDNLQDSQLRKMHKLFPLIIEFLFKHTIMEKNNVLVHCWAGMQRSAIAVAAFISSFQNYNPERAVSLILAKRPVAFHRGRSFNFLPVLEEYYREEKRRRRSSTSHR